jgi:MFS family permease
VTAARGLARIPRGVWALGLVSMCMDVSSEMIHALLPVYLVTTLGTSTLAVGFVEGVAEATAAITKVLSGVLSDRLGKRKLLVALGYGLAALTKPVFPLAPSVGWVVAARFVDRVGKGIRGAPRDALLADLAPPELRGAAFGLRQALDTTGAFLGPAAAIGLMWATGDDVPLVFWAAVVPALLAVALVVLGVEEPPPREPPAERAPPSDAGRARLPPAYFGVLAFSGLFTSARFSEAFLVLRARELGVPLALIPLVLVGSNVVSSVASYPAGALGDRVDRRVVLAAGLAVLIAADLSLATVPGLPGLCLGVGLWGLHHGTTQGVLSALVADVAPPELRGTAFGGFHLVCGLALLLASVVAGASWDALGSPATFLVGAGCATVALAGVGLLGRPPQRSFASTR